MDRNHFIHALAALFGMSTLKDLKKFSDSFHETGGTMPLLFTGHGSPMNGIEDNIFSESWQKLGKDIPLPKAVLCISAHWFTRGTFVTAMEKPQTIHDFGGFPKELFDVQYPAPGDPALAKETAGLIRTTTVELDHEWGLDHGTWSVIRRMYPDANIPVLQLSIDYSKGPQFHYELARELSSLRKKGVLIVGSGNMIHNLRILDWNSPTSGYDWAEEMNDTFKRLITANDHKPLINFEGLGQAAKLSIPTAEHYLPLLYILGLKEEKDNISFFNDNLTMGSISMTSVKFQQ
jgi:4,5-DOPA dioxygenase extradiol